ncbi:MAG: sulfatase [Planctomycetota bacterium]|nr:sulfatase [Planctomycetota bacterium]
MSCIQAKNLLILSVLLTGCVSAPRTVPDPAPGTPNIVFIYADDLGFSDLGCYGHTTHKTPHLDALARGGLRFTQSYANAPNCMPSRACLMTGLYAPRHGIYTVGSSKRGRRQDRRLEPVPNRTTLDASIPTMPGILRAAGYHTALVGKWHLSDDPRQHGFDRNVGGNRFGKPPSYFSPYQNPDLPDGPTGESLTSRLTDEAIRFVESHRDRRFFLFLSHFAVHVPIQIEAKTEATESAQPTPEAKAAGYAAMVQSLDDSVGRMIASLDRLGLRKNTLVIFSSDNGGNGQYTSMAPLSGAKGSLLEGGLRQPLIANWPTRIPAGRTEDTPVLGTDIFPTLAGLAQARLPVVQALDGADLMPLFTGRGKLLPRPLFWHFPVYIQATAGIQGPWRATPTTVMRLGDYKLFDHFEYRRFQLYDLRIDEAERDDLSTRYPELARHLHARMLRWRHRVKAPLPAVR